MEKKPKLPYQTLVQTLNNIPVKEHRVFLKTVYATVARVGEVTRYRIQPTIKVRDNPALTKQDFQFTSNVLKINLLTEKTMRERVVPIMRVDDTTQQYFKKNEAWLTEDIISYVSEFRFDSDVIFDRSTRWGQLVFRKYFPEFNNHIHLLRHWRATHLLQGLATGVPVPINVVAKMGGWSNASVLSSIYDGTIVEDFVRVDE